MNRRQQVLSFSHMPTYWERMLNIIRGSDNSIQTLDPKTLSLKTFPWYALTFARSVYSFLRRPARDSVCVSPDKWHDYCENHEFLNPSCLCALLKPQGKGEAPRYTEVAIYLLLNGCYKGEWVAECAKGYCRYLGRFLIPL